MQFKLKSTKSEYRSDLLHQLNQTAPGDRDQWSSAIQLKLKKFLISEAGYWGAYQNLSVEPALDWTAISKDIQWCFPQIRGDQLGFQTAASQFETSSLGVREPVEGQIVEVSKLRGVIVPGLAFSKNGHRLGRGKGYYDRTLQNYLGKKVAVCFGLCLVDELPNEPHDVLFNHIVTESSIYQADVSEGDLKWN